MTGPIEQDHFLYVSSFVDKYVSVNTFKFLIFFNLLTFNLREVNRTCSVLWLAVHRWCHTFMCTHSINSGSSLSWQRKLMISFMVPTKPDWSGLVLSTQNLSYKSEFVYLPSWYRALIANWWRCFLDMLVLFLFACVFWSCSALSSLGHRIYENFNQEKEFFALQVHFLHYATWVILLTPFYWNCFLC